MKLNVLLAASLLFVGAALPVALAAPAAAQRTVVTERTVVRTRPAYRQNRHRYVTRRVCTNRFYDGRRHRVCRTVRRYR